MSSDFSSLSGQSRLKLADLLLAGDSTASDIAEPEVQNLRVLLRQGQGDSPVFLFHPITGDVSGYVAMANHLQIDNPLIGIKSPLLSKGAVGVETMEDMAELYINAMGLENNSAPIIVGGWSMGGMLAFEIGGRLHDRGYKIDRLLLFDAALPVPVGPNLIELVNHRGLIELLLDILPRNLQLPLRDLVMSKDISNIDQLNALLMTEKLGFTARQVEITHSLANMLHTHFYIIKKYHTRRKLTTIPTLIIYAGIRRELDVRKAWAPFIQEHMARYVAVDGDHFSILQNKSAITCAKIVTQFINA